MASLISQLYSLFIITIYCGGAKLAAFDIQLRQNGPLCSQYEVAFNSPLVVASGTTGQASTELPEGVAPNRGGLAGAVCSSNDRQGGFIMSISS